MKITEIAIKRPAFVAMVFTALAVIGIFSATTMGVDLLPKMQWPMVFVTTPYPGAGPKEVETQVTKPIEEALSSINNMKSLRSISSENISMTYMEFTMTTDIDVALNEVERKINEVRASLPKDVKQPIISKADLGALPILRISITSNLQNETFFQFVKDNVKPVLEQIPGVASIQITGGKEREIRIEVDNDKLRAYNLSITQVSQALAADNLDFPTGKVEQKEKNYVVRVAGKFDNLDKVRNLVLASTPMGSIYLKDIANVIDTYKEGYTLSRLNDNPSVGLLIQKASDANSIQTSNKVQAKLKELEEQYKANNIKFTIAQDLTTFTRDSIDEVLWDLALAIVMVAVVLFFFLHNFKNSLIVLLSIPTSLISSFIMMAVFGFTINLITLMALTLVIGILVDDSIVVLENIHRHLVKGEDSKTAAIKGRSEIGLAAIAITLVDVVVFLPIAMVSGIVGKIFREFALTVVVSTLFSLFVSFTLTPLLASRWSKIVHYTKDNIFRRFFKATDRFQDRLAGGYKKLLEWSLNHRLVIILISIFAFIFSLTLVGTGLVGAEFMPQIDRGEFAINVEMALGTSVEKTDEATHKIENMIRSYKEVTQVYTLVGSQQNSFANTNASNYAQIQVKLIPKSKRRETQQIINEIVERAQNIPGVKATASLIGMFGGADEAPIYMEVKGNNLDELIPVSEKVLTAVSAVKGTRDVKSSWEEGQPEVRVVIDREKIANFGLTLGEVAMTLRNALEGDISTKFKENDTEYDMRVVLSKKNRENPADVANATMVNHMGQQIKLSDVASIYYGKGPSSINRKNRSRVITITANVDNSKPMSQILGDIDANIAKIKMPPGVTTFSAGTAEDMSNMMFDMLMAIGFAILFVYMIMVSLFESFVHPFTIMFSVPVALVGAFLGLFISGNNINMFSLIGVLLSIGLVTKNAILLVDYTNTLRARGMGVREALLEAGPTRLRPILMTTATMIFGMTPLAIGLGGSGDMRRGMAVVVIGALISSTMLTLVLVPVVYTLMEGLRNKFRALFRRNKTIRIERLDPQSEEA